MTLEYHALAWLRFEKRCPIVMLERGISYISRPDALGITTARYMVEIEIKRSLADFTKNNDKRIVRLRENCLNLWPRYF